MVPPAASGLSTSGPTLSIWDIMGSLLDELKSKAVLLSMVDHEGDRREDFRDPDPEKLQDA